MNVVIVGHQYNIILIGFFASTAAGLLTFVGALPVLLFRKTSDRTMHTL